MKLNSSLRVAGLVSPARPRLVPLMATLPVERGRRALLGSGAAIAAAVALANALNAVFQFALGRILGPREYGLLAALVLIVVISQVPTLGLQASIARDIASRIADGDRDGAGVLLRSALRAASWWGGGILLLCAVAYGPLAAGLGAHRALPVVLTGAAIALGLGLPVAWAGLWGEGRFAALGVVQIAFAAVRLAAAHAVALAGGGAAAVMAGVAGATAAMFIASLVPIRSILAAGARGLRVRFASRSAAASAAALTVFTVLTSLDLLVGVASFPAHRAGQYAAASVGARVLLLVPIGVTTVLFPRVATLRDEARERRHLLAGLAAVAVMAAVAVAVMWAAAGPLLDITYGPGYEEASAWLGPLSLAMGLYALAMVYVFHFLSLARMRVALLLLGLLLAQLAAFGFFHAEPRDLIGVQLGLGAVTLVACELWYLSARRRA
jgi:O-antigen/teichoic acid export membrane protein